MDVVFMRVRSIYVKSFYQKGKKTFDMENTQQQQQQTTTKMKWH